MMRKKIKLGDLLVSAGAITEEELMEALSKQKELGMKLGQTLVQLDYISQDILNATLQQQLGIEFISLAGVKLEDSVL
jgi:type IV pilus assembly protein PilB